MNTEHLSGKKVIYFSDGYVGQNYKNFVNLTHHKVDFDAVWLFFSASHET